MVCEQCRERDAVVELIRTGEAGVNKLHLCEKCAAEMGVETITKPKHALGEFLQAVQQQMEVGPSETGQCTFCSATLKDFRATGRLGCARCYAAFEGTMRDLLRRVHGQSRHVGRRYEHPLPGEMDESTLLGELRDRLRRAIDSEQFELAADLRDRIREHE